LPLSTLFWIFFRAGWSFGGGVTILAALEAELVDKRRLLSKDEFMEIYAVGRVVPSGTMTALAIAYGHRFHGFVGGLVALAGLLLPATAITLGATAAYGVLRSSPLLPAVTSILLPAAIALIASAALKLGSDVLAKKSGLLIAFGAFVLAYAAGLNPGVVLVLGGLAAVLFVPAARKSEEIA